jgi:hypothetical protein
MRANGWPVNRTPGCVLLDHLVDHREGGVDRTDHAFRPLGACRELRSARSERRAAIELRIVEPPADRPERQAVVAADQDLLQVQQIVAAVQARLMQGAHGVFIQAVAPKYRVLYFTSS